MEINKELLETLLVEAKENPRLRQNFDLRTSSACLLYTSPSPRDTR